MLHFHLREGLPSDLFPSGFPTRIFVYISDLPHACYMSLPSHPPRFDHSSIILVQGISYIAPHYLVFSSHVPFPVS